jgi:hypothetical protein
MAAIGIGLLILAQLADYVTFLAMIVRHGLDAEANPLVVTIVEEHGLALLTLAKAVAVLLVASLAVSVGKTRPRLAATVLAVGVAVGVLGTVSNVASF